MSKPGAIVTRARRGNSLNAIRSLGKKGIRVVAIDSIKNSPGFHSKYAAKALLCPDGSSDLDAYVQFLRETCRDENCPVILPMDEVSAYVLSKYGSEFPEAANINGSRPNYEQMEMVQDREKLLSLAKELNVPTPRYFMPTTDMKDTCGIKGPWVLKPKRSLVIRDNKVMQAGVRYALDVTELNKIANEMATHGQDTIIQEYIPGEGYGFFALYNKGEIRAKFQHHRLRETPYMGGAASYRESVNIPELEREGSKIPERLRWHGPLMVEFRRDERDGRFKLMEINPRFWGSLSLAICSGVDFPYLFYRMGIEGDCDQVLSYKVGVRCKNFSWELSHLFSVLRGHPLSVAIPKPSFWRTCLSILYSTFTVRDDYLSMDDLRPFLQEVSSVSQQCLRYLVRRSTD